MSSTNHFHAATMGAAIFGEPEQSHVLQTVASPGSGRGQSQSDLRKSHPQGAGPSLAFCAGTGCLAGPDETKAMSAGGAGA